MKRRILVTAGPTREKIDPVRFLSNYSTGTFGYEIAKEARRMGHDVTLISGPVSLKAPQGIKFIRVETARQMLAAVLKELKRTDCLIMAAAVSDWRAKNEAKNKIKKGAGQKTLRLTANPDILCEAAKRKGNRTIVGFALETENLKNNSEKKIEAKKLDLIVANQLTAKAGVFGSAKTSVLIMDKYGANKRFTNRSKRELAKIILDRALDLNIG